MQKANEWLKKKGHIKEITRGRRSAENIARLQAAYEAGTRFSDWEPKVTTGAAGQTVVKNGAAKQNAVIDAEINYTWPEESYEAFAMVNGKRVPVGMREVCSGDCERYGATLSLVAHLCQNPMVRTVLPMSGPVAVKIVPRTTPLPKKLW